MSRLQGGNQDMEELGSTAAQPRKVFTRSTIMLIGALLLLVPSVVVLYRALNQPSYHLTMTTGSFSGAN